MTHEPRTQDEIYESLRASQVNQIAKLTNFTDRSFNYVWSQAFAEEVRELEELAVVAELAGWIDYTGGDVTDEDLQDLGIEDRITAAEVNAVMEDSYLDEYVKVVGVERDDGTKATGEVTFTTQSASTTIPSGTTVTTVPDSNGETIDFVTVEEATTADGVTTVTGVDVEGVEVGDEGNLPSGSLIRLSEPPTGVTGVSQPTSTTGGEDRESNDELRARAKNAVQSSSLGGTVDGIKGYIIQEIDAVSTGDVILDETLDECPPFVDVIVDGGADSEVSDAIEFSRPAGIQHNLVRPAVIEVAVDLDLEGTDIDTTDVDEQLTTYLLNLGLGQNIYDDVIASEILSFDDGIVNLGQMRISVESVSEELHTYESGTQLYKLDFTYEETNGSITITDDSGDVYTEGVDFSVDDVTGDGWSDTVNWGIGGDSPDDGEDWFADYDVSVIGTTAVSDEYTIDLVRDETLTYEEGLTEQFTFDDTQDLYEMTDIPFDTSTSIQDASTDNYVEGTDYDIVDDSGNGFAQTIDWSVGGGQPDNGETFTITYDKQVYFTDQEIRETPEGVIRDNSGDTYDEDTDYNIVDVTGDGENDAIEWDSGGTSPDDAEDFYFTYITEGDLIVPDRKKVDPGTISVEVE